MKNIIKRIVSFLVIIFIIALRTFIIAFTFSTIIALLIIAILHFGK